MNNAHALEKKTPDIPAMNHFFFSFLVSDDVAAATLEFFTRQRIVFSARLLGSRLCSTAMNLAADAPGHGSLWVLGRSVAPLVRAGRRPPPPPLRGEMFRSDIRKDCRVTGAAAVDVRLVS